MNKHFEDSLCQGAIGEHVVWNLLIKMPNVAQVIDVRDDERFRNKDIDFLMQTIADKRKVIKYVEVKTDFKAHETGNFVYEVSTSGNVGCLAKTEADYVFYYLPGSHVVHLIDMRKLNDYLDEHKLFEKPMGDNAKGFLIKIEDLIRAKVIATTWNEVY